MKKDNVPCGIQGYGEKAFVDNYECMTHGTGRLMLFAGDQKIEHLNDDFYGDTKLGPIPQECNDPEHLFKIASKATIGVFATQLGLIMRYGRDYPKIPYLIKLNSKSHLVPTEQRDPLSKALWTVKDVYEFKAQSNLPILGVGYTVYLASEDEHEMLTEAAQIVYRAHWYGLVTVLWMYPRGKAVGGKEKELEGHLIAGAAGVGACLGADFVKVNYPKESGKSSEELLKEAVQAAGNTGVITSGGSSKDPEAFLQETWLQMNVSGARGNATGRNIHQKPLEEAVRMANAIASITLGGLDVEGAMRVYHGEEEFTTE